MRRRRSRIECPTSPTGPTGPLDLEERDVVRPGLRRRALGPEARPGAELPCRSDGGDGALPERRARDPPRHRSALAGQGRRARRRRRRGDLRHPRRRHAVGRSRGRARDVPDLQRLGSWTSAATTPTATSAWRACRTGTSTPRSRRSTAPRRWGCAAWSCVLVGYGADRASRLGAAVAGGERGEPPAPLPHVSLDAAGRPGKSHGPDPARRDVHRRVRVPDEPRQYPRRHHWRRRPRALSGPADRSGRAASAGSRTPSIAWTSSGRIASGTWASR